MTYQAEHIEEGSKRIFAKLFQYFNVHAQDVWQPIDQSRAEKKFPKDRWNLSIKFPSEYTNDYFLLRELTLGVLPPIPQ